MRGKTKVKVTHPLVRNGIVCPNAGKELVIPLYTMRHGWIGTPTVPVCVECGDTLPILEKNMR